jgi:hypothetical protein
MYEDFLDNKIIDQYEIEENNKPFNFLSAEDILSSL